MMPFQSGRGLHAVIAAVVVAAVVSGCGGGDDGGSDGDGGGGRAASPAGGEAAQGLGEALGAGASGLGAGGTATTAPGAGGGGTPGSSSATTTAPAGEPSAGTDPAGLPVPTIPTESSPPTTSAGTEPQSIPGGNGDDPLIGQVYVDLEPGGYLDFPVRLNQGQHIQVLSSADDGVMNANEVYAPDGTMIAEWESGEEGVVSGYYWDDTDALPVTGTYVFRVVHVGGGHEPFLLTFYGQA